MPKKVGVGEDILPLPKGGGALQGLGESFNVDRQKGVLSFSIPIASPPGRHNLIPSLALTYSSGSGNSPFGLGWSLNLPFIIRKTSKGIPQYRDSTSRSKDRDTFLLSGNDDLILINREVNENQQIIESYRTKIETQYLKIKRTRGVNKDQWEIVFPNGVKNYYETEGCVYDAAYPEHIFKWLLTKTEDPFGNIIVYKYRRDDQLNILDQRLERNHEYNQIYLTQIQYMDYMSNDVKNFLYSIHFDYQSYRPDPFSYYKAGFEIRTIRRCQNISIKLHKNGEQEELIKKYEIQYYDEREGIDSNTINALSLISQIKVTGFESGKQSESFPPIEFEYNKIDFHHRRFENIPFKQNSYIGNSLSDSNITLIDIFGDGLPSILETQRSSYRYWRNNGNGFDPPKAMEQSPAETISDSGVMFADMLGKGGVDLLVTQGNTTGFYELRFDTRWNNWRPYKIAPSFNLEDPNVRLFDMNGDGLVDVCFSTPEAFLFFMNQGKNGWSAPLVRTKLNNLDVFPAINFGDYQNRVRLADLSGSGMQDMVWIHQQQIDYWPNLGHGQFGKRLSMLVTPSLPFDFDPKRLFLNDIDGDGCADLIYIDQDAVHIWSNRQGNSFTKAETIHGTPPILPETIQIVDMKGHGTPGIIWSKDRETANDENYKFLDLMSGIKPYLLKSINNNIGSQITITYRPSTWFYTQDRNRGFDWKTHLPFPVYCVSKVETLDYFSQNKITQEYHYHHGHWDEFEREFCGFGRVDQRDTQTFFDFNSPHVDSHFTFNGIEKEIFSPPVETRYWYHLGAVADREGRPIEIDYSDEYWYEDPHATVSLSIQNSIIDSSLPIEKAHALRAFRGALLRTENYGLEDNEHQAKFSLRPYTVSDSALEVIRVNDYGIEGDSIYSLQIRGQRTAQWDRGDEPLIQWKLLEDYDEFGQAQTEINIAIPRERCRDFFRENAAASQPYLTTLIETRYAKPIDPAIYSVNRIAQITHYDIKNNGRLSLSQLIEKIRNSNIDKEIIGQTRNYYDGNAFQGLPLLEVGRFGSLVRSEKLILTSSILNLAYNQTLSEKIPPYLDLNSNDDIQWPQEYNNDFRSSSLSRYIKQDVPGIGLAYFSVVESRQYDFQGGTNYHGLLLSYEDEMGNRVGLDYDNYRFTLKEIQLSPRLKTQVEYDYRVVKPNKVIDLNGNQTVYQFNPLGLLESITRLGKADRNEGDENNFPSIIYRYGLNEFAFGKPIYVHTIQRQQHYYELVAAGIAVEPSLEEELEQYPERFIQSRGYTDGFGRLLQKRTQANPIILNNSRFGDANLSADQNDFGRETSLIDQENTVVVSGWQVYDNKGQVVKKFEPFFDAGWDYEKVEVDSVYVQMKYDPRGRTELIIYPNKTVQRIIYGKKLLDITKPHEFFPTPWEYHTYDANDNSDRIREYYDTPQGIEIDGLGRTIKIIDYKPIGKLEIENIYNLKGDLLAVKDTLGRQTFQYIYDLNQKVLRINSIDAGVSRMVYNAAGNLIEKRDSNGSLLLNHYDHLNRLKKLWASDDISSSTPTLRIHNFYGDELDLTLANDNNLNGQSFEIYDEAGLIIFKKYNFKGNVVETERQVIKDDIVLDPADFVVNWETMLTQASHFLDTQKYDAQYTYDALNRMTAIETRLLNPQKISFSYNHAGTLRTVELNGIPYVKNIFYNAKGQRLMIQYGNGIMTRYRYDPQTFWLQRMRTERYSEGTNKIIAESSSVTDSLQDILYEHDLIGNILKMHERSKDCGIPNSVEGIDYLLREFQYDSEYQLIRATGRENRVELDSQLLQPWLSDMRSATNNTQSYVEDYIYDDAANFQQLTHTGTSNFTRRFDLIPNKNQLQTITVNSSSLSSSVLNYQHDHNGNLSREGSREFRWNYNNQMIASNTGNSSFFLYGHMGMRVKKIIKELNGDFISTIYINNIFEHTRKYQVGSLVEEDFVTHIMDDKKRIAIQKISSTSAQPSIHYHLSDHIESSVILVDPVGNLINREEYTPYGETSFGGLFEKRYRFNAKERDKSTELYYYGARYYAPWMGRWLSCDPLGIRVSVNLYRFNINNPLKNIDKQGLQSTKVDENNTSSTTLIGSLLDEQGQEIFNHWARGDVPSGELILNNEKWSAYMKSNLLLKQTLQNTIRKDIATRNSSGKIDITLPVEIENGYLTGYNLLHHTNEEVGDFRITGDVIKSSANDNRGSYQLNYKLTLTWNDIIDPNPTYNDQYLSKPLELFYTPKDYIIRIQWSTEITATKQPTEEFGEVVTQTSGYPFTSNAQSTNKSPSIRDSLQRREIHTSSISNMTSKSQRNTKLIFSSSLFTRIKKIPYTATSLNQSPVLPSQNFKLRNNNFRFFNYKQNPHIVNSKLPTMGSKTMQLGLNFLRRFVK